MSSDNFYSILGINADSLPEDSAYFNDFSTVYILNIFPFSQVRKAYKKRALQTHPDRLPQGATADDKRSAEEQFRKGSVKFIIRPRTFRLFGDFSE